MKALKGINPDDIIFIDIETVRGEKFLKEGTPTHDAWAYKSRYDNEGKSSTDSLEVSYAQKAALYAEFGKIVCITVGRLSKMPEGVKKVSFHNFYGDNEKELLEGFTVAINKVCDLRKGSFLFGHAIKGFDMPFIFRRCIINGIEPNKLFDLSDMKPWEATAKDTLELWKNGAFYSASLLAISNAMGLPSPKCDISGSEVSDTYWNKENGLDIIVKYCQRDVLTLINIYLKLMYKDIFIIEGINDIKEPVVGTLKKSARKKPVAKKIN